MLLVLALGLTFGLVFGLPHRRYSVTINSVSGLDLPPSKNLTLDPQFNLTLRLASASPGRGACMDAGTYVHVSYRCVPLATSTAAPCRLCVGPMKSREQLVVSKGTGVQLPGFLMDSLTVDLRSGVEAFNVKIGRSAGHHDAELVASCGVRRIGDTARCDSDDTCPDLNQKANDDPAIISTPIFIIGRSQGLSTQDQP